MVLEKMLSVMLIVVGVMFVVVAVLIRIVSLFVVEGVGIGKYVAFGGGVCCWCHLCCCC